MVRTYTTLELCLGVVCVLLLYTLYAILIRKRRTEVQQRIVLQPPVPRVYPYWVMYGDPNWSFPGGTNIRPPRTTRLGYKGVASGGFGFGGGGGHGGHH